MGHSQIFLFKNIIVPLDNFNTSSSSWTLPAISRKHTHQRQPSTVSIFPLADSQPDVYLQLTFNNTRMFLWVGGVGDCFWGHDSEHWGNPPFTKMLSNPSVWCLKFLQDSHLLLVKILVLVKCFGSRYHLNQSFSNFNRYMNHLGHLVKLQIWFK